MYIYAEKPSWWNGRHKGLKRFWTLGEFLGMGTHKTLGKNDEDINERKKLLQKYKATVSRLQEKLE